MFYNILIFIFIFISFNFILIAVAGSVSNESNDRDNSDIVLSICSINVNGFSSDETKHKRIELSQWLNTNSVHACCIQDWYKQIDSENYYKPRLPDDFTGYNLHYCNNKTAIIYRNDINFVKLKYNLKNEGLDITWGVIECERFYLALASVYHSPSFEATWEGITAHIKQIKKDYKNKSKPIYFNINGDANARHHLWAQKTNARGDNALEFATINGMNICNVINMKSGKTDAIDLSFVSDELNQYRSEHSDVIDQVQGKKTNKKTTTQNKGVKFESGEDMMKYFINKFL